MGKDSGLPGKYATSSVQIQSTFVVIMRMPHADNAHIHRHQNCLKSTKKKVVITRTRQAQRTSLGKAHLSTNRKRRNQRR